VKGVLHHDDSRQVDAPLMAIKSRQLDCRFVSLAAGIAEENLIHAGQRAELVSQRFLQGNPVEVRGVDQSPGLLAQGARQLRVGMPQTVHRNAGDRIKVLVTVFVVEPDAFAARKSDGLPGVGLHEMFGHRDFQPLEKQYGGKHRRQRNNYTLKPGKN
jgi:hypothetical protein